MSWFIYLRIQVLHRLEKYINLKGFLEKSLKIKYALKSNGKSCISLEVYEFFYFLYSDLTLLMEI